MSSGNCVHLCTYVLVCQWNAVARMGSPERLTTVVFARKIAEKDQMADRSEARLSLRRRRPEDRVKLFDVGSRSYS